MSFHGAKDQERLLPVRLTGTQDGGGKGGVIRRIGKVLRLQAQPGPIAEDRALTRGFAVEEVSRIELQPRLGGAQLERAAAVRVEEQRGTCHRARCCLEYPVVVVAVPEAQLLIRRLVATPDRVRGAEVGGRAGHLARVPCRNGS